MARIVVVGGGYAGVMVANRLAGRCEVVLVEQQERFVERIRLHELAAGSSGDVTVSYDGLLNPSIRRIRQAVVQVRPEADEVELADGTVLSYDRLVLATGSGPGTVPEGTHSIASLTSTIAFRTALEAALSASGGQAVAVRVIGGGLTGVEAAAELAEARGAAVAITLVSRTLVPGFSEKGRRAVVRRLRHLGVTLVADVAQAGPADLVLACTGFAAVAPFGDTLPASGGFRIRPTLQIEGHDRIYVAGDAGAFDQPALSHLRMSCATAFSVGAAVADAVAADLAGRPPTAADVGYLAQCLSIGRAVGVIQHVGPDDRPRALVVSGRPGAFIKEQVCRQTQRWLRKEARKPGSYRVKRGPKQVPATV